MNLERLIVLLKALEGWRDYVYDDKSPWPRTQVGRGDCYLSGGQYKVHRTGGTATIGYGETSAEVIDRYWGRRITQDEALAIMRPRAQYFADGVRNCIRRSLTAHQWEACACRAYQTGVRGFCRSEVATLLNAGNVSGALDAWRRGFPHPSRSETEIAHFLTPDEEAPPMRFVSRAEWGARAPRSRTPAAGMRLGVGVHWLGPGGHPITHEHCGQTMRWVQRQHMDTDQLQVGGAADFAYNAGACPHGWVYEGRGPKIRNAANGGGVRRGVDANAGWASILYLGSKSGPDLTRWGMDAINDAAAWLGVAGGEWLGHQDFKSTECPGNVVHSWVRNGHPRGSAGPDPRPPDPDKEDQMFFFWHFKAMYLCGPGWRSPWGMHPHNIDPLVATGRYPIAGKFGEPNDLFNMLAPTAPVPGPGEARPSEQGEEEGYVFEEEPEFSFRYREMLGV